jgi:hypothetical protein
MYKVMETAREIIEIVYGFDGWVFGGYVRDNVVLDLNHVTDIDICFPEWVDVDLFIRVLDVFFDVCKYYDRTHTEGLYMSKCSKRLMKLEVDGVHLDVVVTNGGFHTWSSEQSTDLSCNLFYMSRTVPLGIRYVPLQFRHKANFSDYLIRMTKKKQFVKLYDSSSDNFKESNMEKIRHRVEKMQSRGWVITSTCY